MLLLGLLLTVGADDAARAQGWAKKAKPIATCTTAAECDAKWAKAKAWVQANSRFQIAVDQPNLLATHQPIYANTDLSFVVERRIRPAGGFEIAARAWCGNTITCKPKPKVALADLAQAIGS